VELVTQKEFAALVGVSPAYVCKLVKQGRLPVTTGADGKAKLDPAAARAAYEALRDPGRVAANALGAGAAVAEPAPAAEALPASDPADAGRAKPDGGRGGGAYMDHRSERERLEVERRRIDLEERAGGLVKRADVAQVAGETARGLRDALLALPGKLGPLFALETDEHVIARRLALELSEALRAYAKAVRESFPDAIGEPMGEA